PDSKTVAARCPDERIANYRSGSPDAARTLLLGEYRSLLRFSAAPHPDAGAPAAGWERVTDGELRAPPAAAELPGPDRDAWRLIRRAREAVERRRFVGVIRAREGRLPDAATATPGRFDGALLIFDLD